MHMTTPNADAMKKWDLRWWGACITQLEEVARNIS
jgi:hypothetical protein